MGIVLRILYTTKLAVSGVLRNFVPGRRGGSTNSVEDRENGDVRTVAPLSRVLEAGVLWYKKFHFIY